MFYITCTFSGVCFILHVHLVVYVSCTFSGVCFILHVHLAVYVSYYMYIEW